MDYDKDYRLRSWKVTRSDTACKEKATISFGGDAGKVEVRCSTETGPYRIGQYVNREIVGEGYKITIIETDPKYKIEAKFDSRGVGGSWTAEDTSGGAGGDGREPAS